MLGNRKVGTLVFTMQILLLFLQSLEYFFNTDNISGSSDVIRSQANLQEFIKGLNADYIRQIIPSYRPGNSILTLQLNFIRLIH